MTYIQGESRNQTSLFPVSIDEVIPEDHLVRVIDAYVSRLDLKVLGFDKAIPKGNGRPPYDPADLLKLYIYGYFQRVRSSRRLEAECQRNIEVMWLLNRLKPDFKTIADFRKDNSTAFSATCRAFVQFCRTVGLVKGDLVAIDGSKFKAVASARRHICTKHLKRDQEKLDRRIAQYLKDLDSADRDENEEVVDRGAVKTVLEKLTAKRADNVTCQALMQELQITQFISTESDARMMRTPQGMGVAYNVQTAVDAENSLIVHHEVTQDSDDRKQLEPMAKATQEVLEQPNLSVTADAGYSNGAHFQACEDAGITAYVPINRTVNSSVEEPSFFRREDFAYDRENDRYQCPAGHLLKLAQLNNGQRVYRANANDCGSCALKKQCTKAQLRSIRRHAHEDAFEQMEQRMQTHPEMVEVRRSIVEHSFGNLKQWIYGNGRFLLRQLKGARAEMALAVSAYNLKRAINVLGVRRMLEFLA
ncbi:IS1182 family transposase [Pseudomonas quasicaspiana]|uniref:IS1182 family transposase n=1 Tax=Pseudomonas quasicaspiana TaxID=2829821 RepID=UPI001E5ACDBD|nr:IS1182 family transposase [Pseudomonas quasicaspiana]MCD5972011.1 IS1182 family transposase [Pseudomonas quasicaspiana]